MFAERRPLYFDGIGHFTGGKGQDDTQSRLSDIYAARRCIERKVADIEAEEVETCELSLNRLTVDRYLAFLFKELLDALPSPLLLVHLQEIAILRGMGSHCSMVTNGMSNSWRTSNRVM